MAKGDCASTTCGQKTTFPGASLRFQSGEFLRGGALQFWVGSLKFRLTRAPDLAKAI